MTRPDGTDSLAASAAVVDPEPSPQSIRGSMLAVLLARAGSIVFDGLTYVLTARYFGPDDYGRYLAMMAFINVVDLAADMTLIDISIREMTRDRGREGGWLGAATILRMAIALVGSAAFLFYLWHNGVPAGGVRAAAVACLLLPVGGLRMPLALFRARMQMQQELWIILATRLCNLAGFAILMFAKADFWMFFGATALARLLLAAMAWRQAFHLFRVRLAIHWDQVRTLFVEALPMALSGVCVAVQLKVDIILLAQLSSKGVAGLFGAVAQLPEYSLIIPSIISAPILPLVTLAFQQSNSEEFRTLYQRLFDIILVVAIPIAAVAAAMPRETATLLFGERYADAGAFVPLLLLATVFLWVSHATAVAAVASGLQWHFIWIQAICVALYLGLNWLLIPEQGAIVSAWVRVLTAALAALLNWAVVWKRTGIGLGIGSASRTALTGVGMALVMVACSGFPLVAAACAGLAFYLGVLWLWGGFKGIAA